MKATSQSHCAEQGKMAVQLGILAHPAGSVVDIGGSQLPTVLQHLLHEKLFALSGHQLQKPDGKAQHLLPSAVLSDGKGLDIWKRINRLPRYYQTRDEIELFEKYGEEIARYVPSGATLIDFGGGDLRKIKPLLDILESQETATRYLALDLSKESLETGLEEIKHRYKWIHCLGLWGSFNGDLDWIHEIPGPKWFLSLGSVFGNDWFEPAVANLQRLSGFMGPEDRMLLGQDSCKDPHTLWLSYHDEEGLFEGFIRNGLEHTNRVLGYDWYKAKDWTVGGKFVNNPFMHQFVITAKKDLEIKDPKVSMIKGTQIDCYEAFKYDPEEMGDQFKASGLQQLATWQSPSTRIYQYLLAPPSWRL